MGFFDDVQKTYLQAQLVPQLPWIFFLDAHVIGLA
jgi:hypothetical protein